MARSVACGHRAAQAAFSLLTAALVDARRVV